MIKLHKRLIYNVNKFLFNVTGDSCGYIQHYGGSCVHPEGDSSNPGLETTLVISPGCDAEQFYFCRRTISGSTVEIYHMNTGLCIAPNTRGQNSDKLVLRYCGSSANQWHWIWSNRNIRWNNNGKCWHPYQGSAYPSRNTKIVTHADCYQSRLNFVFHEKTKKYS